MILQLLLFNIGHFVSQVFGAFVFFSCGWLYLDSSNINKKIWTPKVRAIGFFLLALMQLARATLIDVSWLETIVYCSRLVGFYLILISLIFDPIIKRPKSLKGFIALALPTLVMSFLSFGLCLIITVVYRLKTIKGLEKQLNLAFFGFLFLTMSEFMMIINKFSTTNVFWSNILIEYGPVWILQHVLELTGMIILAIWIWGYINFRHQIQLFITSLFWVLIIFVTTTLFFCFVLLNNLEKNVLSTLQTDAKVLQYLVERLKKETLSNVRELVNRDSFTQAFLENDRDKLYEISTQFMLSQSFDSVIVATKSGEVLMRTDDKEKFGDNILNESIEKNVLEGGQLTLITTDESMNFPVVKINASVPIYQKDKITGFTIISLPIDNVFVDEIKNITGLDTTIFGGDKRVATTFLGTDGITRSIGTKETDKKIIKTVLNDGQIYSGKNNVLNIPYYSVYLPLKNYDGKVVGMVYVGKEQTTLFETARKSVNITFIGSTILILISIFPTYLLSKFIRNQMEA